MRNSHYACYCEQHIETRSLFNLSAMSQMEHDRQRALKVEADKVVARKKLSEVQRTALHAQMQERESLKREVSVWPRMDRCVERCSWQLL